MITVDSNQQTALEARHTGMAVFVSLAFQGGTTRFSTWNTALDWGGYTWVGLGKLATIQEAKDVEKLESPTLDMTLTLADQSILALTVATPETYRGRTAILYMAPMTNGVLVGTPIMYWTGFMDVMGVNFQTDGGTVSLRCKPTTDRLSRPSGLRVNHEQQKLVLSTDLGFEYQSNLISSPQLWLSKLFQTK